MISVIETNYGPSPKTILQTVHQTWGTVAHLPLAAWDPRLEEDGANVT